jgi:hypothetical protein
MTADISSVPPHGPQLACAVLMRHFSVGVNPKNGLIQLLSLLEPISKLPNVQNHV